MYQFQISNQTLRSVSFRELKSSRCGMLRKMVTVDQQISNKLENSCSWFIVTRHLYTRVNLIKKKEK